MNAWIAGLLWLASGLGGSWRGTGLLRDGSGYGEVCDGAFAQLSEEAGVFHVGERKFHCEDVTYSWAPVDFGVQGEVLSLNGQNVGTLRAGYLKADWYSKDQKMHWTLSLVRQQDSTLAYEFVRDYQGSVTSVEATLSLESN
ncbi:MAG: hypothetical protein JST16_10430 [Bdellovibrionales bacterium]|nr:hypothetical protein [Bdellovibrionales bacterium]